MYSSNITLNTIFPNLEIASNPHFPKGKIRTLKYAKSSLEELTAEYDLSKPIYSLHYTIGLEHDKTFYVKCVVKDYNQNNYFQEIGDGEKRLKDAEHSAARKILESLNRVYYFSEQKKKNSEKTFIISLPLENPIRPKLKLYKWTNCCEYCFQRGHTYLFCYKYKSNPNNQKEIEK